MPAVTKSQDPEIASRPSGAVYFKILLKQPVSAGPCIRSDHPSAIHQGQFFKVELFKLTTTKAHSKEVAIQFRKDAMDFFKEESSGIPSCHGYLPAPDNGIDDLTLNCIEVGSYMLNHDPKLGNWISGT